VVRGSNGCSGIAGVVDQQPQRPISGARGAPEAVRGAVDGCCWVERLLRHCCSRYPATGTPWEWCVGAADGCCWGRTVAQALLQSLTSNRNAP
jgi:hypothetical protein